MILEPAKSSVGLADKIRFSFLCPHLSDCCSSDKEISQKNGDIKIAPGARLTCIHPTAAAATKGAGEVAQSAAAFSEEKRSKSSRRETIRTDSNTPLSVNGTI